MSISLFPMIQPDLTGQTGGGQMPLYREVLWDRETNRPVWKDGSPQIVEGREAVLTWAWKALATQRYRWPIYSWDYGNQCESLMGQPYTDRLKRAEAVRYVRECLEVNPYIQEIRDIQVTFEDGRLTIRCRLVTIYGEVNIVA